MSRGKCSEELQAEHLQDVENGVVLQTIRSIKYFKLFGVYYSTNRRRFKKYALHDVSWKATTHGFFWRVYKVLKNEVNTVL